MPFFRWLSVGLAVSSGLLVALWTVLLLGPQWAHAGGGYATPIVGAALIGMLIGFGHRMLLGSHELQLRKLASHVESLNRQDEQPTEPPPARFGVGELVEVVEQTFAPMRHRIRDLSSQRRELEVQFRIAEAERRHLEAILNAITDAVIVTDAFNEVALANKAAARLLSFDLDQVQRQPIERVVRDDALVKLIKDTRASGHAALRRNIEHRLGHNGQATVYDVTLACVPAGSLRNGHNGTLAYVTDRARANGDVPAAGVVTILRDVTREKEIQEMKSDFVSNVSHELRTPLSSIKAYMEMLIDGEADDEATRSEFYNIIQGETNRLSRLIDNILNINRIESGIVKVAREHVALTPLIRDAVSVMLPQARAKRIELTAAPTPVEYTVCADRDMILQSLLNYVSNAIKYTPEGGRIVIEVGIDEHEQMVHVAVRDTGVGVPEADQPYLFEKFYRVSDHKGLAKGTGLGLNLVKHVIETVHGGRVGMVSQLNEGSTFTFALPMAENVQG